MGPHISIKGEHVLDFIGFPVTNSILTTLLVLIGFYFLASYYYNESRKKDKGLFYYALNSALTYLHNLFHTVLHNKTNTFFALLMSFFFFILLNNWSGLIPGVGSVLIKEPETPKQEAVVNNNAAVNEEIQTITDDHGNVIVVEEQTDDHGEALEATETEAGLTTETAGKEESHEVHKVPLFRGGTADLNTTVALALISVFITQFFGFKYLGAGVHLGKYFNFSSPVMLFVGILELILEFARILSFSFRLFGNIFAGEVLLTVVPFLLPVFLSFVSTPMFFMEIFVGLVQAMVFTMLSAVFINMAIAEHH